MGTRSDSYDYTEDMRIPGVPDTSLFCIDQKKLTAFIYDASITSFIVIDLIKGKRISELKRKPFSLIEGRALWCGSMRYVEHISQKILLALFLERDTKRYFAVLFELKIEEKIAVPIEEHYIEVQKIVHGSITQLVHDENDAMYCLVQWKNTEQRETAFHVAKLKIDDAFKISHQILAQNFKVDNFWHVPFISKNSITFFLAGSEMGQTVVMHFDEEAIKQYRAISGDQHIIEHYPPGENYSVPFVCNTTVYYYIFNKGKGRGELWALNLDLRRWHKCFELNTHVISYGTIVMTPDARFFLHGQCANENCSEKAHLYHFGVSFCGKTIFPTIEQLGILLSRSKTQFIYGQKNSGKTLVLLLKAMNVFKVASGSSRIKIYVATNEQRNFVQFFFTSFGKFFNPKNIILFSETDMKDVKFGNYEIFVDGLSSLSFEMKQSFLNRDAKSTITFDGQVSFQSGFEQPRSNGIRWHQLSHQSSHQLKSIDPLRSFQSRAKAVYSTASHKTEKKNGNMEHYLQQSMEAMDQFYDGWWSNSNEKETICIPACHDVFNNRYLGPTDSNAKDFDHEIFKEKEHLYRGQNAELDLLSLFQKCQIGGVFVSGFNSMEFAKTRKVHKKFTNAFGAFETDGLFMHPLLGIFVFEVKATEQSNYLKTKEKAEKQLEKMKRQLPAFLQTICNAKTIPMFFTVCFPNASIPHDERKIPFFYLDKSSFHDEIELKSMLLKEFRPQDELVSNSLKRFTAAVAGYRSLDFLSTGHNALVVHKMIDKKIFKKAFVKNNQSGDGIFLTNEQLAVIDCSDRHQIISGPPGTGKTLLLLRKALASAQIEKEGNVYVLTGRTELIYKFQKFFEQHSNSIVRLPVVHVRYKDIGKYLDNDDIFADEFQISEIPLLQQRLKQIGQTLIVLTGLFNPLAACNIENFLNENNLTGYRHFPMNTVIRSSKEIFDEWKNEYISKNYSLHLGHNINGPKVTRLKLKNSNEILGNTLKIIQDLFLTHENDKRADTISLRNLCIITERQETCSLIKSFLSCHVIPCGSIQEQIDNHNIAAVAVFTETVSHEWPMVITVSMNDIAFRENFFLLACSRCIAKLIVVERDFLGTMEKIDEVTQPIISGSMLNDSFNAFLNNIKGAAEKIGETEPFVQSNDIISHILRGNIFFTELKNLTEFENCQSLCGCWEVIVGQPTLCRAVLKDNEVLRRNLEQIERGPISLPNTPRRFLTRIISVHSTLEYQIRMWKIFKQLVQALVDSVRQENNGIQLNEREIEEERRIVEQLKRAGAAWLHFRDTINHYISTAHE